LVTTHFVAPRGLTSVVEYFNSDTTGSSSSGSSSVQYDTSLRALSFAADGRVTAVGSRRSQPLGPRAGPAAGTGEGEGEGEGEVRDTFDAVVLAVPPPQLLALGGDVPTLLARPAAPGGPPFSDQLRAVRFSSRHVVLPLPRTPTRPW
jgi:hypothetical protein